MATNLVRGSTAHGKNGETAFENLKGHVGDEVEVKASGDNFSGEIQSVERRMLNGTLVGARFVVEKRLGEEVELSTFFKDGDFDDGDYVRLR